jgi:hypothetical protein
MRLELDKCGLKCAGRLTGRTGRESGFVCSFWEVLLCIVIVALVFGTIFNGYLIGAKRTQWSGYSLAAQSLCVQTLEQTRSAAWDIAFSKTEITNLNLANKTLTINGPNWVMTGFTTNVMDIPWKGTNYVMATNYVTIQTVFENGTSNPWVQLQSIRVDTVWSFDGWGNFGTQTFSNSVCTLMAPDNRDPASLGGTD